MITLLDALPLLAVLSMLVAIGYVLFFAFGLLLSSIRHIERPPKYALAFLAIGALYGAAEAAQITLEWDLYVNQPNHVQATQINVYRRSNTPPGPYTAMPLLQVPITVNTVADTSVENGQGYCYQITAYNPAPPSAESGRSNEVCAAVPALPIPPDAPIGLRVRSVTP